MTTNLSGFTVYVRPELLTALRARAERDGRTLSNFVAQYLEGLESASRFSDERTARGKEHRDRVERFAADVLNDTFVGPESTQPAPPARMGTRAERSDPQSKWAADLVASPMKPRDSEN